MFVFYTIFSKFFSFCNFVVLTLLFNSCFVSCLNNALYDSNNANLITLAWNNFTSSIEYQPNAIVVQFYKHWCPHCKRFAPVWRQLADDIETWKPVVKLAVINCAIEDNVETCRSASIPFVPTIHYYPPNWNFSSGLLPIVIKKNNIDVLRGNLTSLIANTSPNGHILDLIEPLDHRGNLTQYALTKKVFLIGEKNDSKIGSEVILDMLSYTDQLTVKRANWQSPWFDQLQLNETQLPILVTLPKRGFVPIPVKSNQSRKTRKSINDIMLEAIGVTITITESTTRVSIRGIGYSVNDTNLYIDDLYKCLNQILTSEILIYDRYSLEKINSLKNFTNTIECYFPFTNSSEKVFFKELSTLLKSHEIFLLSNSSNTIPVGQLVNQINNLQNLYPLPKPNDWITCRGSNPIYRGYTCSLWLLWHTLTVIEYANVDGRLTNPRVAFTMRQFINDFFSCEECRQHFIHESSNISNEINPSDPFSSIIWLWSIHNSVNRRIVGDPTEDPYFPKVQFPESNKCPECWKRGIFDKNQVAQYLINRYNASSWVVQESS